MPLTRETVTAASRIMLPAYVVCSAAFGLVYTFDPLDNLETINALEFPRQVMGGTMLPWGLLFLALTLVMVAAFTRSDRMMMAFGLCCCAVTWLIWGCLYAGSIIINPETSMLAPVLPWFVTTACIASTVSLIKREV